MDNAQNIVGITERREKAGDANILEVNKAKFELIGAANAYKLNEIELVAAENRLVNLNGGQPIVLGTDEFPPHPVMGTLAETTQLYRDTSPELLALLSEKQASEQDVKLSRSMSLPKFSAGYAREYVPGGEKFNGITVGMSIPIFGNRNNVKRAKAQAFYAEAEYKNSLTDMQAELQGLYAKTELLAGSLNEYRSITGQANSIELLQKAFDAGQISVTEYYAEAAPVYETMQTMIDVEKEYHLTCARINMIRL